MAHSPALDRFWRWLRGGGGPTSPSPAHATTSHASPTGLRQQRTARREQLFALVRENMIRLGVLSSHYKFKVLTLDPAGERFIVMIDWQPAAPGTAAGFEHLCESGLHQLLGERRVGFRVKAVYWRGATLPASTADHRGRPPAPPAHPAPTPHALAPSGSTAGGGQAPGHAAEHVSDDELLALQAALRQAGGGPATATRARQPAPLAPQDMRDFEPTVNTDDKPGTEFGSLSETQYGKL